MTDVATTRRAAISRMFPAGDGGWFKTNEYKMAYYKQTCVVPTESEAIQHLRQCHTVVELGDRQWLAMDSRKEPDA